MSQASRTVGGNPNEGVCMKVFVAADASDGEEDDFSWTVPGELVHFPPLVCDCPGCGCERSMAGFLSHKATSCFVVRDLNLDPATYTQMIFDTLQEGGWVEKGSEQDRAWVEEWAAEHLEMASDLPVERPLRIKGSSVWVRVGRGEL